MKKIILAWGGWTRLRPLSTENNPKQFISIFSPISLLQDTVQRLTQIDWDAASVYFSTHQKYGDKIIQQIWCDVDKLILEPERKNTAPAIALVIKYLEDVVGCDDEEIVLITPADHVVSPEQDFSACILSWVSAAQEGNIVIFGVTPTKAETGYGYIKCIPWWTISSVVAFTEKPDEETANKYLASGEYLWNAGIFMFTLGTIKKAFATYCPWLFHMMQQPYATFLEKFHSLESISFDYAVMEKASNVLVCPMHLMRSDIWSWDAIDELLAEQKVSNTNPYLLTDDQNNLVFSQKKIIVDGIKDSFIIISEDWAYVAKKWHSQSLRKIV